MTTDEMIIGVQLGVQKVDSNAYDSLINEEILYYLNKAQFEYIRRQSFYLKENMSFVSREDKIKDLEAVENLGTLLNNATITSGNISAVTGFNNAVEIATPGNFMHYVYAQVQPDANGEWRPAKLISSSEIHKYVKSEFNTPLFRNYPLVIIGANMRLFYDSESSGINSVDLTYVKQPTALATGNTSELPVHAHDDVVDLAVAMIMEDLKSSRPYEQNQQTIKGEGN